MPPVGFEPKISAGERAEAARLLRSWVRIPESLDLWDTKTQTVLLLLVENFNWLQRSSGVLYATQAILYKFRSKSLFTILYTAGYQKAL